ncbi:MAG TPA: UDP-N-acetylmuramoyl-L-alanyl-D-glutamate--2,6-diaminopimelate ligase [Candidatus Acidoferrales bacterium]|nr:UDP-N-acetylmuramoyl-L-alanyl-D-glutamate--2,6-diaminopimelate ligase [Candidatus Acidoferrales bacterium]
MKFVMDAKPEMNSSSGGARRSGKGVDLGDLLDGIHGVQLTGPANPSISSVACDSRKVEPSSLFFALPGQKTDGLQFVSEAVSRGAIVIASIQARPANLNPAVTWIQIPRGTERRALATASANFFGHPAAALKLIGITGTNGKTTTTFLVDSILRADECVTGLIGTTGYRTPQGRREALNTTPESLELQRMFAEVRDAGGTHVVLEASSHALAMDRLWGCHFAAAIFTNLTRDHLDYHKNFDDYFAAKRRLFEGTGAGAPDVAVVNSDDEYESRLEGLAKRTLTYGLKGSPDLTAKKFNLSFKGLEFTAQTPSGKVEVHSPLVGRINVYNILAAIGAGIALDVPITSIEEGIAKLDLVPGRFQRVDEGQPYLVVVDYAHTDDALKNLITSARELNPQGRIITVFGAGGERDRTKRPLMGEVAGSLSNLVVLTSDNPRGEDPLLIINDVIVGLQKVNATYRIEPDRERAIEIALDEARTGDMVLLAGKGHETYQVLKDRTIDFDDREMARKILRRKGHGRNSAG